MFNNVVGTDPRQLRTEGIGPIDRRQLGVMDKVSSVALGIIVSLSLVLAFLEPGASGFIFSTLALSGLAVFFFPADSFREVLPPGRVQPFRFRDFPENILYRERMKRNSVPFCEEKMIKRPEKAGHAPVGNRMPVEVEDLMGVRRDPPIHARVGGRS